MSLTELIAALLSAIGVWLTARRTMACWPLSLLAALLYGWVFFKAHLYADACLQAVFCGCLLYGWWRWMKDGAQGDETLHIRPLSERGLFFGLLIGALGGGLWAFFLARFTDDPTPVADALLSSYSLVAQIWAARRHTISWACWIVIDTAYVAMFVSRDLYPTAALYAIFVLLAVHGLRKWQKASQA
ncbi:nicotinamide riboside transporter PnuC [Gluconobacter cerinus]|uniref:Nicotinamide riboside transporter PnuC n=1 Tax=Gluconobacter cerinus TaxID=38307 RepID=A0AAV5NF88_9PROT|nr:nicotinamide riboside transporter PnuC [Gluconobacter cerinus]GBQ98834.1 transporter of nicotinamide mononucleotide PnuC [Gluconobacter cerinus NRIC 0229]GLQ63016.1 aminotransferase [Gluconobacter cerinus]